MDDRRASRALPQLLALALAACGGRYASEGQGGAQAEPGGNDDAVGGASSRGGGKGGAPGAGMSTGVGATGVTLGGSVSSGGSVGSGGSKPGIPTSDVLRCSSYCDAIATYCPELAPATCKQSCVGDLAAADGACRSQKSESLDCITSELNAAQLCALGSVGKFCGSPDARPIACVDDAEQECITSLFGDADACHAVTSCDGHEADMQCRDTGTTPLCSCWVDGVKVSDLAVFFASASAACVADETRLLCAMQLDRL